MGRELRSALEGGRLLVGTVVAVPDVGLAELTAGAVDFVWIDLEHGALGAGDLQPLAIAARAGGAAGLVRLRGAADPALGTALDAGADGVVLPRVECADDVARVAERLRYPPRGSRGLAARRASGYGRDGGAWRAGAGAAAEPVLVVQIESPAAVEAAQEIAAVEGVDALVVGCSDLELALGGSTEPASDDLRDAVAHVQHAAALVGVASGVAGPDDPALLMELADGRSTVLVLGADVRIYARALDAGIEQLRRQPAPRAPAREESHVSP